MATVCRNGNLINQMWVENANATAPATTNFFILEQSSDVQSTSVEPPCSQQHKAVFKMQFTLVNMHGHIECKSGHC